MAKTVRVTARNHHPYLVVDRRTVEDDRLSWAARGILLYLLAKPDDWEIRVEDLRKQGDLGRDAVYAVLNELQRCGYLERVRSRDNRGYFGDIDSTVFEVPVPDLPDTAEPDPVYPDSGQPDSVRPTLLSTKYTKEPSNKVTTTTTSTEPLLSGDASCSGELIYPKCFTTTQTEQARRRLIALPTELAQQLLDELAARLESGAVRSSPLAYLRGMVKRASNGEFTPEAGLGLSETRARHALNEAMLREARSTSPQLPRADPIDPLVQRLEAIRARTREAKSGADSEADDELDE